MKKLFYIILLFLLIGGCKSRIQYIPITEKRIEYKDRLRIDSVYNSDTTTIILKGDTMYLESIKWRTRTRIDTVSFVQIDSIPYPVEVIEYVNKLTDWQKLRLNILNIIGGFLALLIGYKLIRK